ncbi:MAG: trehalose-6-phosphate synthase [Anaerolineales bacterium]|jgi:trehalose 6-phosphate synthase
MKPLIVIVSNRGPFSFKKNADGSFKVERGTGGLVTALTALAEQHDVLWVAAAMDKDDRHWVDAQSDEPQQVEGISLRLIKPNNKAYQGYYNVISNPMLWFIQHQLWDAPRHPSITRETWEAWEKGYLVINKNFAEVVAEMVKDEKRPVIVLPQDYHLYMFPHYLRELLDKQVQIQPFVHIPWPGPDAWRVLPGQIRIAILKSLLASDRVGFQTQKDAFNFIQNCRFYLEGAHSRGSRDSIDYQGRQIKAVSYPISIDTQKLFDLSEQPQTHLLKSQLMNFVSDRKVILRVDRIEPSKNILRGLEAYSTLLEIHPEHLGKVQMLALLVPSRMGVNEYQDYLRDIMSEAGMINARFSTPYWEPVRLMVGDNYDRAIAAMQFYDVLLINPLADGMNLVAKEGALVNQKDGVLVLSEDAGAFYELGEYALTVSPFDVYGTAIAIHKALTMPPDDKQERAKALRSIVKKADIRSWFYDQVDDAMRALESQSKKDSTPATS